MTDEKTTSHRIEDILSRGSEMLSVDSSNAACHYLSDFPDGALAQPREICTGKLSITRNSMAGVHASGNGKLKAFKGVSLSLLIMLGKDVALSCLLIG